MTRLPLLALLLLAPADGWSQTQAPSPVGRWRTIDDETNTERSLVEIRQVGGELRGTILRVIPAPGEPPDPRCVKCEGQLKDQPIVGMTFLWGLKPEGEEWTGGAILDPKSGGIYRAKLSLAQDGQKLVVRGYVGTPLFGRSQTWLRDK
jgi:uncharacterized protein (DUF2147 family)